MGPRVGDKGQVRGQDMNSLKSDMGRSDQDPQEEQRVEEKGSLPGRGHPGRLLGRGGRKDRWSETATVTHAKSWRYQYTSDMWGRSVV